MAINKGDQVAVDWIEQFKQLENNRFTWENHWQEIAELVLPRHDEFFRVNRDNVKGEKRTDKLFT